MLRWFTPLFILAIPACDKSREPASGKKSGMAESAQVASLIDPAKLATLGDR